MIINNLIKKILQEATTDSGSRGSYTPPLQPGMREFDNSKLAPFTDAVSKYKSPLVVYDSYDHDWDLRRNQIKELEAIAKKVTNFIKKHPETTNSDEDGSPLNRTPSGKENTNKKEIVPITRKKKKNINEITSSTTAGEYSGPQELGLRKWKKSELGAFDIESDSPANNVFKKKSTKKNVYKVVGGWEPQKGNFEVPTYDVDGEHEKKLSKGQLTNDPIEWYKPLKNKVKTKKDQIKRQKMNEDLAVWFGEKKKPKGSSQPKGPWVDICKKVDGKHPPCGRSDASEGSYPKCRAFGVAGKMSDSEKRSACQQKRKAEKNDPQSGKGQKPVMVSHKKKTNENMKRRIITLTEDDLTRIVKKVLNEDTNKTEGIGRLDLKCVNYLNGSMKKYLDYTFFSESDIGKFSIKKIENSAIPHDGFKERTSELLYLTISQPNQKIMEFINTRFPNFYWDEALKYVIYLSTTATPEYFCKVMQKNSDTEVGQTSDEWITFFENSSVAYNLPDSIFTAIK